MHPAIVFGIYGSIELFNYAVLEPWLYAARTGVSPVALLLAAAFWTWLWGLAGLLLSVPITVCLVVMGKYIPQLEFLEVLLGDEPALEPYQRLYQRLLTSNRDEADVVLERALREHSLREVCDIAIVPALRLLEADFARGDAQARAPPRDTRPRFSSGWTSCSRECSAPTGAARVVAVAVDSLRSGRGSGGCHHRQAPHRDPDQPGYRRARRVARSAWRRRSRRAPRALEAVVVSALPPEAVPPARAAVKRIRARAEGLPVIVGLWGLDHDLDRAGQRLGSVGVSLPETRVAGCVERIERLRHTPGPSGRRRRPRRWSRGPDPRYTERLKHRRVAQW